MARLDFAYANFGHCWLNYNANNGKADQFGATNTTGQSAWARCRLTNGTVYEGVLVAGDNVFSIPGNANVTVTFDAFGDAVIGGVDSVRLRIPA